MIQNPQPPAPLGGGEGGQANTELWHHSATFCFQGKYHNITTHSKGMELATQWYKATFVILSEK